MAKELTKRPSTASRFSAKKLETLVLLAVNPALPLHRGKFLPILDSTTGSGMALAVDLSSLTYEYLNVPLRCGKTIFFFLPLLSALLVTLSLVSAPARNPILEPYPAF